MVFGSLRWEATFFDRRENRLLHTKYNECDILNNLVLSLIDIFSLWSTQFPVLISRLDGGAKVCGTDNRHEGKKHQSRGKNVCGCISHIQIDREDVDLKQAADQNTCVHFSLFLKFNYV